jgi:hypothetical protein
VIRITKEGRLIALKSGCSMGGIPFVGIIITDPEELPNHLEQFKLHFQCSSDQYNLMCEQRFLSAFAKLY